MGHAVAGGPLAFTETETEFRATEKAGPYWLKPKSEPSLYYCLEGTPVWVRVTTVETMWAFKALIKTNLRHMARGHINAGNSTAWNPPRERRF